MHVPVLRSFAMAALVTLGVASGGGRSRCAGWRWRRSALMLRPPQEVVGVSFQMSFAAVLALIAGYEAMRPALTRHAHGAPALHHAARWC